ncbi:hypothetical protein BD410DRAFT_796374 [Rickenella mellea]|uniref:Uncharacterized protein n=1 Tax=Rickenella mellea TaxID=50990 RepID=A0A4Y7PJA5_9AGAM|nr:hypothetical protein BD410DRAFT_796374 [Rickenella mellea]
MSSKLFVNYQSQSFRCFEVESSSAAQESHRPHLELSMRAWLMEISVSGSRLPEFNPKKPEFGMLLSGRLIGVSRGRR